MATLNKNILTFLLVSIISTVILSREMSGQWQQLSIMSEGSAPKAVRVCGDTIYVATLYHGIWRSTDSGNQWTQLTTDHSTFDFDTVTEFFVDGKTLVALSKNDLSMSQDGGISWTRIPKPKSIFGLNGNRIFGINIEYHGIYPSFYPYNVVQSSTDGQTWNSLWPINGGTTITKDKDSLFMAAGFNIYFSTNAGQSWSVYCGGGLSYLDKKENVLISLNEYRQIQYSENYGSSWNTPASSPYVKALRGLIRIGDIVFSIATHYSGEYPVKLTMSIDNGKNWGDGTTGIPGSDATCLATDGSRIFVGTDVGLFMSSDSGTTWELFGPSQSHGSPTITTGCATPDGMYFGTIHHGVIHSSDNGNTWASVGNGLPVGSINGVRYSNGNLFCTHATGLYVLSQEGLTWSKITSQPLDTLHNIGVYGNENALLVRSNPLWDQNIMPYLSTDGGKSWTIVEMPITYIAYDQVLVSGGIIFFPALHGIIRYNIAENNIDVSEQDGITVYSFTSPQKDVVMACGEVGMKISHDNGETWTLYSNVSHDFHYLASYAGNIFAQSYNGSDGWITVSTDGGGQWNSFVEGYTGSTGAGLWIHANSLYAMDINKNVFVRTLTPLDVKNENSEAGTPGEFSLSQNYPNPFNPTTRIVFSLPASSFTTLKIYDMLGREVQTLVEGDLEAGEHGMEWNAASFPSAVYVYRLQAGSWCETRKLLLLK